MGGMRNEILVNLTFAAPCKFQNQYVSICRKITSENVLANYLNRLVHLSPHWISTLYLDDKSGPELKDTICVQVPTDPTNPFADLACCSSYDRSWICGCLCEIQLENIQSTCKPKTDVHTVTESGQKQSCYVRNFSPKAKL